MTIKTQETDPNHDVIGRRFRAFGAEYFCDSYDPAIGFWMTPADPAQRNPYDSSVVDYRRNVSERAIGRIFHRIYDQF